MEIRVQQLALQEPYYVRSGTLTNNNSKNNIHSPEKHPPTILMPPEIDSLSTSESHASSMHGLSILAPICLCLCMMIVYIVIGALVLYRLEDWPMLDGIYFCFMALSTIGFGDLMPGLRKDSTATLWFCSIYIMSGMALTAMCFNVLHDEIMHRIKHVVDSKSRHSISSHHLHQQQFNLSSTKQKLINEAASVSAANDDYLNSWRYEKNTNLYQRNPTEETLITGEFYVPCYAFYRFSIKYLKFSIFIETKSKVRQSWISPSSLPFFSTRHSNVPDLRPRGRTQCNERLHDGAWTCPHRHERNASASISSIDAARNAW